MGQNVEGRSRGKIRNTTPAIVWIGWTEENPHKISDTAVCLRA